MLSIYTILLKKCFDFRVVVCKIFKYKHKGFEFMNPKYTTIFQTQLILIELLWIKWYKFLIQIHDLKFKLTF